MVGDLAIEKRHLDYGLMLWSNLLRLLQIQLWYLNRLLGLG